MAEALAILVAPHAVSAACNALAFAWKQHQNVSGNKEQCKILIQHCQNLLLAVSDRIRLEGLPDSMQDNLHVLESVSISIRDVVVKLATKSFAWRLLHQDKIEREIKAAEAKLLDAITVFNISAQADNSRLKREITDSIAAAAAKDQSQLVAYLENLAQNDHKILHSLQEHHVRMEELLGALMKHVQDISSSASGPSEKFIWRAVGTIQRLTELVANVPAWQVTSLEVTFDRDNLELLIGKGSFGTVFKGLWGSEVVAVKEMYIEDTRNIDRSFKISKPGIKIFGLQLLSDRKPILVNTKNQKYEFSFLGISTSNFTELVALK